MKFLSNKIAWRYLFAKKTTNAINLITGISVLGTTIGTAALILVLSVFNGFEHVITSMIGQFNPDIRIEPAKGKTFVPDSVFTAHLKGTAGVDTWSMVLEEIALFDYQGNQDFGYIKGVDNRYNEVTVIDSILIDGEYKLQNGDILYSVLGVGIANKLGVNINDKLSSVTVFMPKKKRSRLPGKAFRTKFLYPAGIFSIQQDQDYEYVITSIDVARELMELDDEVSAVEIRVTSPDQMKGVARQLKQQLGDAYVIKDRIAQDASFLKIIRIEKGVSFIIFSLILLLVAFNLVGALWMIVLEKKQDISILKSMGVTKSFIKRIFIHEGLLISGFGVFLGMVLAVIIYALHQQFGLIPVSPNFIVDRYPVQLRWTDFALTGAIVLTIAYLASILPARRAQQVSSYIRQE